MGLKLAPWRGLIWAIISVACQATAVSLIYTVTSRRKLRHSTRHQWWICVTCSTRTCAPLLALNAGTPRNTTTGPAMFRPRVISSHFDAVVLCWRQAPKRRDKRCEVLWKLPLMDSNPQLLYLLCSLYDR